MRRPAITRLGRLANTGKNFWTVEPMLAFMYFGQKNGIEASLFAGCDFNSENHDTEYQTGRPVPYRRHPGQHLPLGGGLAGVGCKRLLVSTDYRRHRSPGRTWVISRAAPRALVPVISYVHKIGKVDMLAELKWLHEVEAQNRLEGDYIWLKVIFKF